MSLVYSLSFPKPHTHCAEVMLEWYVPAFSKDQDWIVKMPVWTPGSYLIREYAKNVMQTEARDETGKHLPSRKIAKNAWAISGPSTGKIRFRYRLYGYELSVRHNWISEEMAFICGAATFVWLEGQAQTRVPAPGTASSLANGSHWLARGKQKRICFSGL
ncbi:MAG: hypothetical protein HC913_12930 [Microscillaceae bacterium]|nr:hypothetical protein [Microscillaceae bacterium]